MPVISSRSTRPANAAVRIAPERNTGASVKKKRRATARRKLNPWACAFFSMNPSAAVHAMIAAPIQMLSQYGASGGIDSSPTASSAVTPIAMQPLPGTVVNVCAASIVLRM